MKLITRKLKAKDAASLWISQYGKSNYMRDWKRYYDELVHLGENPEPDSVDKIIGNKLWTRTECDECGAIGIDVIQLGEEPDHESATANICKPCLLKALDLSA